jgi:hypothetical protein
MQQTFIFTIQNPTYKVSVTHPFELEWFKYLCKQYPGNVYIQNKDGEMKIVVEQEPEYQV